jgi:hypothetical protein
MTGSETNHVMTVGGLAGAVFNFLRHPINLHKERNL